MDSASDSIASPSKPAAPSKTTFAIQPEGFPGLPPGWASDWETFASADSRLQLFGIEHRKTASQRPHATSLFVVHGFGEHGGRYLHWPHYLKSSVDSVYCLDLRGHGRSEGLRGHVADFDDLTEDFAHALRRRSRTENHVVAHSLGAIVALRALHYYPDLPVKSLTLSAPCLELRAQVPFGQAVAAGALSRIWGSCHLDAGLDPAQLSRSPEVVAAYRRDRLVHSRITPRFYTEMKSAMRDTLRHCADVAVPTLMLVPMDDPVVNPDASVRFFGELQIKDRQIRMYRGFYHEPFNENGKETPFEDLRSWLKAHSPFLR